MVKRPRPQQPLPETRQADLGTPRQDIVDSTNPATDGTTQTLRESIRRALPDDVEPHLRSVRSKRKIGSEKRPQETVGGAAPEQFRNTSRTEAGSN